MGHHPIWLKEDEWMRKSDGVIYLVLASPLILLMTFLLYPVMAVLIGGLIRGPSTPLDVLTGLRTQRVIGFTLLEALLSTGLTVLIGLPGSFILARIRFKGREFIRSLLILPFVLPPIVVVVGFSLSGLTGFLGIILAHVFYNVPLILLMVSASLERMDPDIEESAEILGAGSIEKFRHVILPHILPSLLAASVLVFLFCFMSFPIVLALGESRFKTIEVQIWDAFKFFDYGEASTLALVQLLVTLTLALFYVWMTWKDRGISSTPTYLKTQSFSSLSSSRKVVVLSYTMFLLVLMIGPFFAIFRSAFIDPFSQSFTLSGFSNLFTAVGDGALPSLINSILYATLATIFSVSLGIPLAYTHRSSGRALNGLSSLLLLLPLGVSSITVAYGLMLMIAVPLGITLNPWPLIIIAQTIIGLPFSARAIEVSLRNIDQDILDQADAIGASRFQKLFHIELPLIAPGVLVGAVFAFAMAIGEMSATLFIAPGNITLPVTIYHYLGIPSRFVDAGAASMLLVLICLIAFIVIDRMSEMTRGDF
jgi:thiamine transport system permease protein